MADNFLSLLKSDDVDLINIVFKKLRADFNGDLFVAPCSFVATDPHPILEHSHLEILARFRSGRVEMGTDQYRFWGYNFKYIPIELISAVYDRFLGEQKVKRRNQGAYYTPMFLADTAISQVWDQLSHKTITDGRFLDPSCGSGMFLVRAFQRLCEHWRETRQSQTIHWNSLLEILSSLRGWDRDSGAVRIAVFSLYIALLEEVYPPDIQDLINSRNLLPKLWGQTLRHRDFFEPQSPDDDLQADVLIGNPPWSSRKGPDRSSVRWCRANQLPMPSNEDAWAFAWKSLHHLRDGGIVAFLLPAMGFLHNHSKSSVTARRRFIREARVIRIVNFADLRFQLFEGAVRPAALIVFRRADPQTHPYRFEYWTPKADLNLKGQRLITLGSADKCMIASGFVEQDPSIFKRRLWMSAPEAKLFNYLSAIPKLGDLVSSYGEQYRKGHLDRDRWWIGQGFQPFNADRSDPPDAYFDSQLVGRLPHLSIDKFEPLAQPVSAMSPWPSNRVRRKGFERGFTGPRVLVPRGVHTTPHRLRATYLEDPLTFQDIIQAVVVPPGEAHRAKLLAALLNSRVILWYGFHGTASFGAERPEVKQADLLLLPFPSPNDLPEQKRSQSAENGLISLVEEALQSQSDPFQATENTIFEEIDRLAYEFFCLSDREIVLVDDTVERMIPAVQPRRSSFPEIWEPSDYGDRLVYANTLIHNMSDWFDSYYSVEIRLEAHNEDLAILRLSLQETRENAEYVEKDDISVSEALSKLSEHIEQPLPGNFQFIPDFRLFIDKDLYLVKSIQKRFWMRSAAISDADAIALDLQDASGLGIQQSPA